MIYIIYKIFQSINIFGEVIHNSSNDGKPLSKDTTVSLGLEKEGIKINTSANISSDTTTQIISAVSSGIANLGIATSIAGVSAAAATAIKSAALPPTHKVALIIGAAAGGGAVHSTVAAINRLSTRNYVNTNNSTMINNEVSDYHTNNLDNFKVNSVLENNDLSLILNNLLTINNVVILFLIVLTGALISKYLLEHKSNYINSIKNI